MESPVIAFRAHRGFLLITVLIVTAVGLLFGFGALLLFRYQCQLRIDRQHELEKVYAVRSALNYIITSMGAVGDWKTFSYRTESARDLRVIVKPVEPKFPSDVDSHFYMTKSDQFRVTNQTKVGEMAGGYNVARDYEYGTYGATNLVMSNTDGSSFGLAFTDTAATTGVTWWVNIGMRGTGGWLQEDYGRRYFFNLKNAVGDGNSDAETRDVVRLCIIRNVTNEYDDVGGLRPVGCRNGWPLSQEGERALVFQGSLKPDEGNGVITLWEYVYTNRTVLKDKIVQFDQCPLRGDMGLQLAADRISAFWIDNYYEKGYRFSDVVNLSPETVAYFARPQWIGEHRNRKFYNGVITNSYTGKVEAPELRAVFEVEAHSNLRIKENSAIDFLTNFRVTLAYQYDIFLEYPEFVTNRATVAQIIGDSDRYNSSFSLLTYDTHGTENKGFRKDEREWERKRNGL